MKTTIAMSKIASINNDSVYIREKLGNHWAPYVVIKNNKGNEVHICIEKEDPDINDQTGYSDKEVRKFVKWVIKNHEGLMESWDIAKKTGTAKPITVVSSLFKYKVKDVKAYPDSWKIALLFDNQEIRTLDFASFPTEKYPVVKRLIIDKTKFQNVEVSAGGIRWPDFDVDLDPDDLYENSKKSD